MLSLTQKVQAAYDHIAPTFAQVNGAMPPDLAAFAEKLLTLAASPAHILDIGCGAGRDMAWFTARGVKVTGADLSWGMLQEARQQTRQALLQMEMQQLAFRAQTFNAVSANASLLHLPKQAAPLALREFHRVLTPLGLFMLTVQAGEGEIWEGGYHIAEPRFFARYQKQEMDDLLTRCQFKVDDSYTVSTGPRTWLHFICQAG